MTRSQKPLLGLLPAAAVVDGLATSPEELRHLQQLLESAGGLVNSQPALLALGSQPAGPVLLQHSMASGSGSDRRQRLQLCGLLPPLAPAPTRAAAYAAAVLQLAAALLLALLSDAVVLLLPPGGMQPSLAQLLAVLARARQLLQQLLESAGDQQQLLRLLQRQRTPLHVLLQVRRQQQGACLHWNTPLLPRIAESTRRVRALRTSCRWMQAAAHSWRRSRQSRH